MRVHLLVVSVFALAIGMATGWFGHDAWSSDRCLDRGGVWMASIGGCDLPNPALRSAHAQIPIVKDAMRRWAAKDSISIEKAMGGRTIEMVSLPDRECVSFGLGNFDVGGVPTYCYRRGTRQLIWEESDVE